MPVVAKMTTASIEDYGYSRKVKLGCQYDGGINTGDDPENKSFTKATPWGECAMTIDNPFAVDQFRIAKPLEDGGHQMASVHYVLFIDASKNTLAEVMAAEATLA